MSRTNDQTSLRRPKLNHAFFSRRTWTLCRPTLNRAKTTSSFTGGERANVIPDAAQTVLQIRLAVDLATVQKLLEAAIAGRAVLDYKSGHDPVRLLVLDGFEQMIARFTTDIPYLTNWGTPLLIGP